LLPYGDVVDQNLNYLGEEKRIFLLLWVNFNLKILNKFFQKFLEDDHQNNVRRQSSSTTTTTTIETTNNSKNTSDNRRRQSQPQAPLLVPLNEATHVCEHCGQVIKQKKSILNI